MKLVDLGEPTSFLDHVYLDALDVNSSRTKLSLRSTEMFESRISFGATEKLRGCAKPHAKTVALSYDMDVHAKNCVERCCELANKKDRAIKQSLNSLLGRPQFQEGGVGIGWRNVKSMFSDRPRMRCTWHELVDLTFYGQ